MAAVPNSVRLGALFRIPVHMHYSVPLGVIVMLAFRSYDFVGAFGGVVGAALVVLVHELGHAVFVRMFRQRVLTITFYAWGGECSFSDPASKVALSTIAWGGVVAQGVLLLVAWVVRARGLVTPSPFVVALMDWLIVANAITIGLNLVPWPPLDGARAWALPYHLWRSFRMRREVDRAADLALRKALGPQASLRAIDRTRK